MEVDAEARGVGTGTRLVANVADIGVEHTLALVVDIAIIAIGGEHIERRTKISVPRLIAVERATALLHLVEPVVLLLEALVDIGYNLAVELCDCRRAVDTRGVRRRRAGNKHTECIEQCRW